MGEWLAPLRFISPMKHLDRAPRLPTKPYRVNMRSPDENGRDFGGVHKQKSLFNFNQITEFSHG